MKTKIMAFAGLSALALLIGAVLVAASGGPGEELVTGDNLLGEMLGKDKGSGDMERAMNEDCDTGDADQTREREQLQDGSCEGEPQGEPTQEKKMDQGETAPEDADQTREREQLQDGSCGDDAAEDPVKEQTRERKQLQDGSCDEASTEEAAIEQKQNNDQGDSAPEDADQTREREQLQDGSCEGEPQGEPTQEKKMDQGETAPEDADQTREREQLQDGTCSSDDGSTDEDAVSPDGIQQQDRDRDQVNGGSGPQNRNGISA